MNTHVILLVRWSVGHYFFNKLKGSSMLLSENLFLHVYDLGLWRCAERLTCLTRDRTANISKLEHQVANM